MDMDARAIPRRVFEWILPRRRAGEARAALRAPDDPREAAARQARLVLEVARRTAEPAEALPPGAQPAVLLALYRDAIYWALAARRPDRSPPPADLRALWDASNPQLVAASPPDNDESAALRRTLFDDYAPRGLEVSDADAARARTFAEALVWDMDAPRRRVERSLRPALAARRAGGGGCAGLADRRARMDAGTGPGGGTAVPAQLHVLGPGPPAWRTTAAAA